jgi:ribosomal-protein-alanine N-acetyltransferase
LLEVRKSNEPARRLYEAAGFSVSGERAAYYADGEDAVLMHLDLEAC